MNIRYISSQRDGQTNSILAEVAERASAEGIVLAGTIQLVPDVAAQKCEIVLGIMPDGPVRNVSMDLGPGATGCRLDAGALENVVAEVQKRLSGAQALIVNKFGKQEAAGRGLAGVIGQACTEGKPVLVGVSPEWLAAFLAFAGDAAQPIEADTGQVTDWLRAVCRQTETEDSR